MDIVATKGTEYLIVLGYLLLLVPFWFLVQRARGPRATRMDVVSPSASARLPWVFAVPPGLHFHRGHTWMASEADPGVVRLGMDDFAWKLLGPPTALDLPGVGDAIESGEPAWRLRFDGHSVPLLSPVRGEVVAVNESATHDPGTLGRDPYGRDWLVLARVRDPAASRANLLPSDLAEVLVRGAASRVGLSGDSAMGAVLQDGGVPLLGFARALEGERWTEVAEEHLLTRVTSLGDGPQG